MRLIFLHIPKNAGTSLHRVIEANYSAFRTFSFRFPRSRSFEIFSNISCADRMALQVVKGHWPFGLHVHWTGDETRYLTLLRDPLKRLVSEYRYIKRNAHLPAHAVIHAQKLSLRDALIKGVLSTDEQTRWLLGPEFVDNGKVKVVDPVAALDGYRSNGGLFGLVERFDESLLLFQEELGWRRIHHVPVNVAPRLDTGPSDITTADLDAAAEATSRDRWLVETVKAQWESEWRSYAQRHPDRLESFRVENEGRRIRTRAVQALRYLYARCIWRAQGRW